MTGRTRRDTNCITPASPRIAAELLRAMKKRIEFTAKLFDFQCAEVQKIYKMSALVSSALCQSHMWSENVNKRPEGGLRKTTAMVDRTSVTLFGFGIFFGFSVTYLFSFYSRLNIHHSPKQKSNPGFIFGGYYPQSPHSHGENDNVAGPSRIIEWADEHFSTHSGTVQTWCICVRRI